MASQNSGVLCLVNGRPTKENLQKEPKYWCSKIFYYEAADLDNFRYGAIPGKPQWPQCGFKTVEGKSYVIWEGSTIGKTPCDTIYCHLRIILLCRC